MTALVGYIVRSKEFPPRASWRAKPKHCRPISRETNLGSSLSTRGCEPQRGLFAMANDPTVWTAETASAWLKSVLSTEPEEIFDQSLRQELLRRHAVLARF